MKIMYYMVWLIWPKYSLVSVMWHCDLYLIRKIITTTTNISTSIMLTTEHVLLAQLISRCMGLLWWPESLRCFLWSAHFFRGSNELLYNRMHRAGSSRITHWITTHLIAYSFIHMVTHSNIDTLTHSLLRSLMPELTLVNRSPAHSLKHSLTGHSLTHSLTL